ESERARILELARSDGILSDSDAYRLLSGLLRQPPDGSLLDLAEEALKSKASLLAPGRSLDFKLELLRQCREVAQVGRWFLWFGRGSRAKRVGIARLEVRLGL